MDAQEVLSQLESQGLLIKDIQELSGIGLATLYDIKSGRRSGKTSLPTLQRLLHSSQSYVTIEPANSVVESSLVSIDDLPVSPRAIQPQRTPQRMLQPYNNGLSLQEQEARGQAYRQSRSRYSVTPDELMRQLQLNQLQMNRLEQKLDQQQKQRIGQVQREKVSSEPASMLNLIGEVMKLAHDVYVDRQARQQEVTEYPQYSTSAYRPAMQRLPEPATTYVPPATLQPHHAYGRPGVYGIPVLRQPIQQEEKPNQWQQFRKFMGF